MKMSQLIEKTLAKRESEDAPLRIVQAGHPALRATSKDLAGSLEPQLLEDLINAMVVTMHEAPGVGVAAPQVGIPLRLVVMEDVVDEVDEDDDLYERRSLELMAVINPSYEGVEGSPVTFGWEGCLSVDGWRSIVPRPKRVRVRGTAILADGSVRELDEEWSGWRARIFQHEADHLEGTLCHDRSVQRSMVEESYAPRYTELSDAVHYLGLSGDITALGAGQVDLDPSK